MTKVIITGSCSSELGEKIARYLNIKHIKADITKFANGELCVELRLPLNSSLEGVDVMIVQSVLHDVNDKIIELFLIIDSAKRAGVRSITFIAPYLAYSRSCNSIEMIVNILKSLKVSKILTLDLHSEKSLDIFEMDVISIDPAQLFASAIANSLYVNRRGEEYTCCKIYSEQEQRSINVNRKCYISFNDEHVLISPDFASITRTKRLAQILNADFAIIEKERDTKLGICNMKNISRDITGKRCIIVEFILIFLQLTQSLGQTRRFYYSIYPLH